MYLIMDTSNTTLNHDLLGIDRNTTVNIYYLRDNQMNVNNNETIVKALKKLGYYDIESDSITRKINNLLLKIKNELTNDFHSTLEIKH